MDLSKIRDIKDLQALLDLMGQYGLAELELMGEGRTIRFRKTEAQPPRDFLAHALPAAGERFAPAPPPADATAPLQASALATSKLHDVPSPMVGTFYRASSPEAEPFVREGDRVEAETVLCIIEAMKVMNEIPSGVAGIAREILVKNGESVEFGQPLFRIELE